MRIYKIHYDTNLSRKTPDGVRSLCGTNHGKRAFCTTRHTRSKKKVTCLLCRKGLKLK